MSAALTHRELPMRLIGLAVVLALSLVLAPQAVYVQEAGKRPRIGVLGGQSPDAPGGPPPIYGLRKGLRELGYVEGQNVAIEWRWARGQAERFAELMTSA